MGIRAAAYDTFLSLDAVKAMGFWSIVWVIIIVFLVLGAKAKKIGTTSIGKNEWGMLEILSIPLFPIPFGLWPFMKGLFHVKQVSTAPVQIDISCRREVADRVLLVNMAVFVRVTKPREKWSWSVNDMWRRFLRLRRDLVTALYGVYDENMDDSESPSRIDQTKAVAEAAARLILLTASSVDEITLEKMQEICGDDLRTRFGEYLDRVYIREDAPVDGQLWKEGRGQNVSDDVPPAGSGETS